MAGLIVVIIVLGYMMNIAMSHSSYVQAEIRARSARESSRKAYYAAMAGVNFVISRLRLDPNNTYVTIDHRLYFTSTVNSSDHSCAWNTASYNVATLTGELGSDTYRCYNTFTQNTDTNTEEYLFHLNTFPGVASTTDYLIKSQGIYRNLVSGTSYRSQVWAKLYIDTGSRFLSLVTFRTMGIQSLTPDNGGAEPDDFWDWEKPAGL